MVGGRDCRVAVGFKCFHSKRDSEWREQALQKIIPNGACVRPL